MASFLDKVKIVDIPWSLKPFFTSFVGLYNHLSTYHESFFPGVVQPATVTTETACKDHASIVDDA